MIKATVTLQSLAPYSQSRQHNTPFLEKEAHDDYEKRTWREKSHYNDSGNIFIPPMAFKFALCECAKFLSEQIAGKGKATYTKHFEAGVLCMEPIVLPDKKDTVLGEWFSCHADGRRGSGRRVMRCFPCVPEWEGKVDFYVLDRTITEKVFRHHMEETGKFIGIGRSRPRQQGFYGRFKVNDLQWVEE